MWDLKRIIQFGVVFAVVYGGLMYLRSPLSDAYAYLFRAGGNIAFSRYVFWGDGNVRFVDLRLKRAQLFKEIDLNTLGMLPPSSARCGYGLPHASEPVPYHFAVPLRRALEGGV